MKNRLSVLMLTKNSAAYLERALDSVNEIADEIVIVDDYSHDPSRKIAKKTQATIYCRHDEDLGGQRSFGLSKTRYPWVLMLDSDEVVSPVLAKEIKRRLKVKPRFDAFRIPYHNHLFGRRLSRGGENYRVVRLFRKHAVTINSGLVHEHVEADEQRVGQLKHHIDHFSYQNLWQMAKKFTNYAVREAKSKRNRGEKSSWEKIVKYPIHMFWSRFVKDKGFRDGYWRLPLDLGFAYMEWLTYVVLALRSGRPVLDFQTGVERIGYIIVTFNTSAEEKSRLRHELRRIKKSKDMIYWIDNTFNNHGFAFGVNQGIRRATKDGCNLFMILNPDVSLRAVNRKKLLYAKDKFDIWGGVMRQNKKTYFGGTIDAWRLSGGLITQKPNFRFIKRDFVTGSLMMVKKSVIDRIGLFDEEYFMYYEDVDFCQRAQLAGLRIGIDSRLTYRHFETSKSYPQKNRWLDKSRWRFFWKYANWKQKLREIIRWPKTIIGK